MKHETDLSALLLALKVEGALCKDWRVATSSWEQSLANSQQGNGDCSSYSCKERNSANNRNDTGRGTEAPDENIAS